MVIEPVNVSPLTAPVPPTEVTVPRFEVYEFGFASLYGVNPRAVVTSKLVSVNVPPRVRLPLLVTDPESVSPLTAPAPPTEVTVPRFEVYEFGFMVPS